MNFLQRAATAATLTVPVLLIGSAASAAHPSVIPMPDPAATIGFVCDLNTGGTITVTYTNTDGEVQADFQTVINGAAQPLVTVVDGGSVTQSYPLFAEGEPYEVTVTNPFMQPVTSTGTSNCFDAAGELAMVCSADGPVLEGTITNTGQSIVIGGLVVTAPATNLTETLDPGEQHTFTVPLVEDGQVDATLGYLAAANVVLDQLSETADCEDEPVDTTPTSEPEDTTPDDTTPDTDPDDGPSTDPGDGPDASVPPSSAPGVPPAWSGTNLPATR